MSPHAPSTSPRSTRFGAGLRVIVLGALVSAGSSGCVGELFALMAVPRLPEPVRVVPTPLPTGYTAGSAYDGWAHIEIHRDWKSVRAQVYPYRLEGENIPESGVAPAAHPWRADYISNVDGVSWRCSLTPDGTLLRELIPATDPYHRPTLPITDWPFGRWNVDSPAVLAKIGARGPSRMMLLSPDAYRRLGLPQPPSWRPEPLETVYPAVWRIENQGRIVFVDARTGDILQD